MSDNQNQQQGQQGQQGQQSSGGYYYQNQYGQPPAAPYGGRAASWPQGGGYAYGYPGQYGGGYYPQEEYYGYEGEENYEQDDYENLEEIERAMYGNDGGDNEDEEDGRALAEVEQMMQRANVRTPQSASRGTSGGGGGSFLPPGAVPRLNGVLSVHAKEFWFPECRNCECCKGFKHGCPCCVGSIDTCTAANCVSAEHTAQVASELSARGSSSNRTSSETGAAAGGGAAPAPVPAVRSISAGPAVGGDNVCKFFLKGVCRFGSACRDKHPGAPEGAAAAVAPLSPTGKTMCMYFQQGNCQFGDKCKFSHEVAAPPAPPAAAASASASAPATSVAPPAPPAEGDKA